MGIKVPRPRTWSAQAQTRGLREYARKIHGKKKGRRGYREGKIRTSGGAGKSFAPVREEGEIKQKGPVSGNWVGERGPGSGKARICL